MKSSLQIYNSILRKKQAFSPLDPQNVRMYVCGMTVYDFCHLGHARVMVVFDLLKRWLRASGYPVTYVRNITDIDDKIIRRAVENGESIRSLTDRFTMQPSDTMITTILEAETTTAMASAFVTVMTMTTTIGTTATMMMMTTTMTINLRPRSGTNPALIQH